MGISVDNRNLEYKTFLIEFTSRRQRLLWNIKSEVKVQKKCIQECGGIDESKTKKAIWETFHIKPPRGNECPSDV